MDSSPRTWPSSRQSKVPRGPSTVAEPETQSETRSRRASRARESYAKDFARYWEDLGNPLYKLYVPTQVAHNLGTTYYQSFDFVRYSVTFEIDNLTDASLFDLWGVQRPGRSFNLKLTAQL